MLERFQPLLFLLPPEAAHRLAFYLGKKLQSSSYLKKWEADLQKLPQQKVSFAGLDFLNPLGLAAGFDKNAELISLLSFLGFGFLEVGTITPLAQAGNPKPRMFREKARRSLVNRLGFNNRGMIEVAENMARLKPSMRQDVKLGINIGKNKLTPNEIAASDYQKTFAHLSSYADYVVINLSSPNTPGLRDLQSEAFLREIKQALGNQNTEVPIFVKLAPELKQNDLAELLPVVKDIGFNGIILTNTLSVAENLELEKKYRSGGISGDLLRMASRESLLYASKISDLPIISVGGIDSADEIRWRLDHGAKAVQIYTSLIYSGPSFPLKLLTDLYGNSQS